MALVWNPAFENLWTRQSTWSSRSLAPAQPFAAAPSFPSAQLDESTHHPASPDHTPGEGERALPCLPQMQCLRGDSGGIALPWKPAEELQTTLGSLQITSCPGKGTVMAISSFSEDGQHFSKGKNILP